jgi:hypothetical protein
MKAINTIYKHWQAVGIFLMLGTITLLTGCEGIGGENRFTDPTTIAIEDPVRHYYPILQGQKQNIIVKIKNTGKNPLKIYNVLPSCGCLLATFSDHAIAPGNYGLVEMEYNSNKNIGKVALYTTIIANTPKKSHTIYFDLNVVPGALYTKDYEELYQETEGGGMQEAVEGENNERGYEIDSTEVRNYKG